MLPQIFIVLYLTLIPKCTSTTPFGQAYIDLTKQPCFVDKTEFIGTFFDEDYFKHIFITAPPGFGKTTNLQMLRLFSEIELDSNHKPKIYTTTTAYQIFQSLAISNYTDIIENHLAQHVVIYIDLHVESDTTMDKAIDLNKTVTFFNKKLYQSFESYKWLLDIPKEELSSTYKITTDQIELLKNLNQKKLPDESNWSLVLYDFANILHLYFGKDVMILIDNYDSVLNNFFRPTQKDIETFYEYVSTVLCNTFDNSRRIMSRGLVMGTTSLALPHILTTLSKSKHYNFLSDHSFTPFYGFTDPEATNLLIKYNCSIQCRRQVKKFYNGYKTKTKMIAMYNPSSMTQYLTNINHPNALRPYRNITTNDYNFLLSFKEEKILGHLLGNLVRNMTAKFEQYESYSLQNFTTFFGKCEEYKYKITEVEIMFSYFFDQGFLTHGLNTILIPDVPITENSIVHMFETPNLEVWFKLKELSTQVVAYSAPKIRRVAASTNTTIAQE
ncbi:hypothetical protein U1Q18_051201 [Sarracenia purpurea var. burkii]